MTVSCSSGPGYVWLRGMDAVDDAGIADFERAPPGQCHHGLREGPHGRYGRLWAMALEEQDAAAPSRAEEEIYRGHDNRIVALIRIPAGPAGGAGFSVFDIVRGGKLK